MSKKDNSRSEINSKVLPFILLILVGFILTVFFGKNSEQGLLTFSNALSFSIVITMIVFGIQSTLASFKLAIKLINKKQNVRFLGQLGITIIILAAAGSVIWLFAEGIIKRM
jgi:hypothetical protein